MSLGAYSQWSEIGLNGVKTVYYGNRWQPAITCPCPLEASVGGVISPNRCAVRLEHGQKEIANGGSGEIGRSSSFGALCRGGFATLCLLASFVVLASLRCRLLHSEKCVLKLPHEPVAGGGEENIS